MKKAFLLLLLLGGVVIAGDRSEPERWPGRALVEEGFAKNGLSEPYALLRQQISILASNVRGNAEDVGGDRVLPIVERIQADPLSAVDECLALTRPVEEAGKTDDLPGIVAQLARAGLSVPVERPRPIARPGEKANLDEWLSWLEKNVLEIKRLRDAAFARVPEDKQRFLAAKLPVLFSVIVETFYLEGRPQFFKDSLEAIRLTALVDREKLLEAGLAAAELGRRENLEALRKALAHAKVDKKLVHQGVKGELIAVRSTKAGDIIMGGPGKNEYDATKAALIVDVGGDDTYLEAGAASFRCDDDEPLPSFVSLILDLGGNDTYRSERSSFTQGGALLGVALLADLEGNDTYTARRFTQGTGILGVGILADYAGNDVYQATELAQGVGAFGVGLLYEGQGDDRYTAALLAQGVGFCQGVGCLYDRKGNDRTKCTGVHPSTYGTQGEFHGLCQGLGMGFRGYPADGKREMIAGGGVGILLDGEGQDEYDAGEFGLGCGYFFGLGLVKKGRGNDTYRASRYGLATGAHFGIGVLVDMGGDDHYSSRSCAEEAGNWDASISVLWDAAGNDTYECPQDICQGSAKISSLAILHDGGGSNVFKAGGAAAQGDGGGEQDAKGGMISIGVLLDEDPNGIHAIPGEKRTSPLVKRTLDGMVVGYGLQLGPGVSRH